MMMPSLQAQRPFAQSPSIAVSFELTWLRLALHPVRVLQLNPTFYPSTRDGGPSESLLLLARGLLAANVELEIVTTNGDGPTNSHVPLGASTFYKGVPVRYFNRFPKLGYAPSQSLLRHLKRVARDVDLVHVHALFNFPSTAGAALLRSMGVPYVTSPRGMCEPWALGHRSWKKWPYWRAIERGNVAGARAVHATSDEEASQLRLLFPTQDVFVVPNPVELPSEPLDVARAANRIVFLGRLHPVKGLEVLVAAMSLLTKRHPDVELVLAGPDHHGELARVEARLASLAPRPNVRWIGEVHGDAKSRFLASATALALTSHSESFGRTVVEALAHGTPVVVSRACPWASVAQHGAGFWVDNEPEAVADALARILEAPSGGHTMRLAARTLANDYDVDRIGRAMLDEYRRVLAAP